MTLVANRFPQAGELGKAAPRHDARTLRLAKYLQAHLLPTPPDVYDLTAKAPLPWGMMLNDVLGDCTCAAAAHLIMAWTANAAAEVVPTDAQVLAAYEAVTGYTPADPASDRGAVELDVLNYWRQTGVAGHRILAYAALEPANQTHVRAAVATFGGCYIGVALPASAQGQAAWDVVPDAEGGAGTPGSWGGHAVCVVGYDAAGLTVVTWGQLLKMTWAFWEKYCDEAYAIITQDFLEANGDTPGGLDLAQLQADLREVTA